ncbi:PREDICTED: nucleosome assembly protein 1;2-like [Populus euphratica]|uniref:Nucleosome assembly protein 12-like n=1 Tax=Populus euphratica TaxID=75702 RepID=A0AAJ6TCK2_POPEU|nr:PREDICTED: nucleosome assembly protein 1;2-like [Populus euphratica]
MKVSLSPKVRKRMEGLRHLQSQHDELEAQFLEERKALEAKYQKLYQPLYTERFEIVNGQEEVEGAAEEKGVPEFWLAAMKTHEVLAAEIKGRDEGALKFINDIKWSRLQDHEGFKLEFYFNPNPYFKNSVLTKTYLIIDELDPILSQAIGTEIEWYPGKCLTKKVIVKKKPRRGSKMAKTITKIKKSEIFFPFFPPPRIPVNEDGRDDDAYDELQDMIELDYIVGMIIRDKTIPHAVSWFTGEATKDHEAEKEEERKEGVKEDVNEDRDEEKERALKKGVEDERKEGMEDVTEDHTEEEGEKGAPKKDVEEEEEKNQVEKKKNGGAQIQETQKEQLPPECRQL